MSHDRLDTPTDTTPASAEVTRFQCRHIRADGNRCGSICLRGEDFCFYHHTTRRPPASSDPTRVERRSRNSRFHLAHPEDRASIQLAIGEIVDRLSTRSIDPRRAGLILYALQIASTNLPRFKPQDAPQAPAATTVETFTLDPTLGPIAPPAEWQEVPREQSLREFLMERWEQEP